MALFPQVRTLIVKPSNFYSLGKPVALRQGSAFDAAEYPISALTDGSGGENAFRFMGTSGSIQINLGANRTPNIVGVFGHNFDVGLVVNIQASTSPTMVPLLLNRGVGVKDPAFWLDIRGFPATASYWQLTFVGNSRPVTIGEVVVAFGDEYEGIIDLPFSEDIQAPQERAELEDGSFTVSASGSVLRAMDLTLRLPDTDQVGLRAVFDEAGASGIRVIVVPETRRNDIWLTDWPDTRQIDFAESHLVGVMSLPLREEAFGVYVSL